MVKFVKRATDDTCNDDSNVSPYSNSGSGSNSGSSGSPIASLNGFQNNQAPFGGDYDKAHKIFIAHGVLASLAFVILFPFGAIGIRLLSFPGLIWVHAAIQALSYVVFIVAFGLGIYMATELHMVSPAAPISPPSNKKKLTANENPQSA